MKYHGKVLETFAEIFNKGLQLARENKEKAQEFFKQYIQHIYENNDEVYSLEEAENIAKSNFGYWAGYYNQEVCDIIYNTFQCSHPIFGDKPFDVSPEEAYKKGLEMGRKLNEI